MPDVDIAVGVRRAVVQDELFAPGARRAQPLVKTAFVPLANPLRLALRQVAAHGERRFRHIQRVAVGAGINSFLFCIHDCSGACFCASIEIGGEKKWSG